jgi:hypothetical protein
MVFAHMWSGEVHGWQSWHTICYRRWWRARDSRVVDGCGSTTVRARRIPARAARGGRRQKGMVNTGLRSSIYMVPPEALVADLSPQQVCYNGYIPLISRDDLAGFHSNGYMPNG